jgi:hypothetical protein
MTEIIYKNESYAIVGACFEVYNEKGCGFLEPVYQECFAIEFDYQRIPAIPKPSLTLSYRERILTQLYQPDLNWGSWSISGIIRSSNTNASPGPSRSKPERIFPMPLFDLFASIRVIRGRTIL